MANQPLSSETQEFLSDVADKMDAVAATLESQNGAVATCTETKSTNYFNARFGSKLIYTTCYMISYGVCFPVFMACRYVPQNNKFVDGLLDGSEAANRSVDKVLKKARDWRESRQQSAEDSLQESEATEAGTEALAMG